MLRRTVALVHDAASAGRPPDLQSELPAAGCEAQDDILHRGQACELQVLPGAVDAGGDGVAVQHVGRVQDQPL